MLCSTKSVIVNKMVLTKVCNLRNSVLDISIKLFNYRPQAIGNTGFIEVCLH